MPALPATTDFTASTVTEGQFKTALSALRGFLAGLLGTTGEQGAALAALGALFGTYQFRSAATTLTSADRGKLIQCSGTWTLALPAASAVGAGWAVAVRNSDTGVITIDPDASETINSAATLRLDTRQSVIVVCNGTNWITVGSAADFGVGAKFCPEITNFESALQSGFFRFNESTVTGYPTALAYFGGAVVVRGGGSESGTGGTAVIAFRLLTAASSQRVWLGTRATETGALTWVELWHKSVTYVDVNGFLRQASPIVQLTDAAAAEPADPLGAIFARLGTGHYTLSGVPPLAAAGWQVAAPLDMNGNRILFVATAYDSGTGTLTVQTSEPVWDDGLWIAGAPKDIPAGSRVDLRFDDPA